MLSDSSSSRSPAYACRDSTPPMRTVPVEAGRVRTSVQRRRFAATLRTAGRRADAVTAITEGVRTEVARHARLPERDIAVWRSGCAWCDTPPEGLDRPAERGPDRDRFVLLYHGTMTPNRGLFESVEAMARERIPAAHERLRAPLQDQFHHRE